MGQPPEIISYRHGCREGNAKRCLLNRRDPLNGESFISFVKECEASMSALFPCHLLHPLP